MLHMVGARWAFVLAIALAAARADAGDRSEVELLEGLRAHEPGERARAAAELRERGPEPRAVPLLLRAAKHETDHEALVAMLLALGASGMVEALGIIQLHAQSPARDLQRGGQRALELWLRANRVIGPEEHVPEPPHRFYGAPPRFPRDRPAGHALITHLWRTYEEEDAMAPIYEAPPPDGVPPGFHFEPHPRIKLIVAGSVVFGALYSASSIPGALSLADHEPDLSTFLLMPGLGPIIMAVPLFRSPYGLVLGIPLFVDGLAQIAGIGMLIAGATACELKLAPDDTPELMLSPQGAALRWSF